MQPESSKSQKCRDLGGRACHGVGAAGARTNGLMDKWKEDGVAWRALGEGMSCQEYVTCTVGIIAAS